MSVKTEHLVSVNQGIEKIMGERGERRNEGKLKIGLLSEYAIEETAKVATIGATKYAPRNWERGMPWSEVTDSLERHLLAFKKLQDFDEETGLLHMAHVMWNAQAILHYYKYHPEFDDRRMKDRLPQNIALDIDGVLGNFRKAWEKLSGVKLNPSIYKAEQINWEELNKNKDFWMGIESIEDPANWRFEPKCYITARNIPVEWCTEWLLKNGFPIRPIYKAIGKTKLEIMQEKNINLMVEDKHEIFLDIVSSPDKGCFLYNQTYNEKYDVGHWRIKQLSDLFNQ